MSQPAIRVENLSKAYRIGKKEEIPDTIFSAGANLATSWWRNFQRLRSLNTYNKELGDEGNDGVLWALKDVSFEVAQGEVLGIIGRNGAGKSTLLKILSRITTPTSGQATIRGRVSSLLEVGTGFHPELSGRDNVYMNGTILGMKKREIDRKFDEIVDFSGVERFLDTPVKRYSSGMKVRLAFAVAAHLEPELLIIDEVLAVGDAEFQRKCLGKMQDVAGRGRTVLFVSHRMAAVSNLCTVCCELSFGTLKNYGEVTSVISDYMAVENLTSTDSDLTSDKIVRLGSGDAKFRSVIVMNDKGASSSEFEMGHSLEFRIETLSEKKRCEFIIGIGIFDSMGIRIAGLNSGDIANQVYSTTPGEQRVVTCTIPFVNLMPGKYFVNLTMYERGSRTVLDRIEGAISFEIISGDFYRTGKIPRGQSIVFFPADWQEEG